MADVDPKKTGEIGNDTRFKQGNPGKPLGATNKLTKTVKETVLAVFNELQDDPKNSLLAFAQKHPRDFYNIAAKLIPTDIKATIETENVKVNLLFPEGE